MTFYETHTLLCWYLLIINVATFITYAADKVKAMRHAWRIPEATLLTMAALGGSLGALTAMLVCRHKIRSKRFMLGVPILLCLHIILLVVGCMALFGFIGAIFGLAAKSK